MSKRGIVALIGIVALTIAGGVFWYLELVPLTSSAQKAATEVVAEEPPAPLAKGGQRGSAQARGLSQTPEKAPAVAEEMQKVEVPKEETAPHVEKEEETLEVLPLKAEEKAKLTIIDFDTLMDYLTELAPADALQPVELPLLTNALPSATQEVSAPPAPPADTPSVEEATEDTSSVITPQTSELSPLESKTVPTATVARRPTIGFALNAVLPIYKISPFEEAGYGIEGTLLLFPKSLGQGTLSVTARQIKSQWLLDVTLGTRIVANPKGRITAHLGVGAGAAITLKTPVTVGLLTRATAGVSWNITNQFAITASSGVSASWFDFSNPMPDWHFEAVRVGFSITF